MPFHLVYDTDLKVNVMLDQYITKMYWRLYCRALLHRGNAEYETREENDTSKKKQGKINSQIEISLLTLY